MRPLSPRQLEVLPPRGESYLVVDDVFTNTDPSTGDRRAGIGGGSRRAKELVAGHELSRDYHEEPFETQLTRISGETDKVAMAIWSGVLHGPAVFNLIRTERLLDIAEQMLRFGADRQQRVPGAAEDSQSHHGARAVAPGLGVLRALLRQGAGIDGLAAAGGCDGGERVHVGAAGGANGRGAAAHVPGRQAVPVDPGGCVVGRALAQAGVRAGKEGRGVAADKPDAARELREPDGQGAVGDGPSIPGRGVADQCDESRGCRARQSRPETSMASPDHATRRKRDFPVRSSLRPREVVTDPAEFARLRSTHVPGPLSRKWQPMASA